MTIENLGSKLYSGTKADRKSDSLGSSADGTNTGITLLTNPTTNNGTETNGATNANRVEVQQLTETIPEGAVITKIKVQYRADESSTNTKLVLYQDNGSGTPTTLLAYTAQFNPNVSDGWYEANIAYDGSGSSASSYTVTSSTAGRLWVGIWANADSSIYKSSGTQKSMSLTYASGATAPTSTFSVTNTYSVDYNFGIVSTLGNPQKLGTGAYSFDGTNDYTSFGEKSQWDFLNDDSTDFNISFWLKNEMGTVSSNKIWFSTYDDSQADGILLQIRTGSGGGDNTFRVHFSSASASTNTGNTFEDIVPSASTWHHYSVNYDKTTKVVEVFKDGASQGTHTVSAHSYPPADQTLHIGARQSDGNFCNIDLDDMGIYKRKLTATEIGKLANNNQVGSLTSNVASYIFAEQANSRLKFVVKRGQGSGISGWIDTGLTSSSSNWAIKFKLNVPTRSVGGNNTGYFGFSSTTVNQDSDYSGRTGNTIGYYINLRSSGETSSHGQQAVQAGNTYSYNLINDANSLQFSDGSTAYTKWIKIVKNGNTVNMTIHDSESDADNNILTSGSDTATGTDATAGAFTNLRYLKWYNVAGGSTDEATIYFSDLKLYDDTTSTSGTPTKNYPFVDGDAQLVSSLTNKSELKANFTMDTQSGKIGSANGVFDGSTYATANGLRSTISGASALSISCWINPTDITDSTMLGAWHGSLTDSEVLLYSIQGSNKLNASIKDGSNNRAFISSASISANEWTHAVMTYDGSNQKVKLYINGALDSEHTSNVPSTLNSSSNVPIIIGAHSALVNFFGGAMNQLLVYSDVLSLTEIQTLYNSGSGDSSPSTSSLVSWYKLQSDTNDTQGSNNGTNSGITFSGDICPNDFSSTSALEELSGVRISSIFQQTDSTPSYWWFNGTSWVLDGTTQIIPTGTWNSSGYTNYSSFTQDSGKITYTCSSGNGQNGGAVASYDLGSGFDGDTNFIFRFRIKYTNQSDVSMANTSFSVGIGKEKTVTSSQGIFNSTDQIMWRWAGANHDEYRILTNVDGSNYQSSGQSFTPSTDTYYYFEIVRSGATSFTMNRYSDDTYKTVSDSESTTSAGNPNSLRYIQMGTSYDHQIGSWVAEVDEMKIQSGVSEWLE